MTGGPANLRDAGAVHRAGVLYRSDVPAPGDTTPAHLAWPPRTVVDLRETAEREPVHPLAGPGTGVVSLPMMAALDPWRDLAGRSLAEVYAGAVEGAGEWLPVLVATAARGLGPVLVHCTAGKDRTGIAVAVLLRLAGVARDDVVADHVRTAEHLDAVHRRLSRVAPDRPVPSPRHTVVDPEAVEALLNALGEPDATRELARRCGTDLRDLDAWEARLRRA